MKSFLSRIACEHFAFGLLIPVYIVLLIEQLDLSLLQAGWAVSITAAASFVLEVPAGLLADRIQRKYILLVSSALHLLAYTALFFAESIHLVLIGAVLTGAGFAFASGTEESYLHDYLEKGKIISFEKLLSKVSITDEVATIFGMVLSSLVLMYFSYSTLIGFAIFSLALAVLSALFLASAKSESAIRNEESAPIKNKFDFRYVLILISSFILLAVMSESGRLLWQPQLLLSGWSAAQLGYVFAVLKLGSIAGAYIAGVIKIKNVEAIFLGGIVGAIGLVVFSLDMFLINLCGLAAYLLSENFIRIHTTSFILSFPHVQNKKATALSLFSLVNNSYLSISGVLLGIIATSSLSTALVSVAVIKILATVALVSFVIISKRRHQDQNFFS